MGSRCLSTGGVIASACGYDYFSHHVLERQFAGGSGRNPSVEMKPDRHVLVVAEPRPSHPPELGPPMVDHLDFGSAGLRLDVGDHICALYFGTAERDEILLPYLRAGLRAGDKCVCILDNGDATGVIDRIGAGLDASGCIESEQLAMVPADEAYTRSGEFFPDQMIEYLDESVGNAIDCGEYPFVRAAGEMCWVLPRAPGAAQFIDYESKSTGFAHGIRRS